MADRAGADRSKHNSQMQNLFILYQGIVLSFIFLHRQNSFLPFAILCRNFFMNIRKGTAMPFPIHI